MAVERDDRESVVFKWSADVKGDENGIVEVRLEDPNGERDASWTRAIAEEKKGSFSVPEGLEGSVLVTVTGAEGTHDEGTIKL